MKNVGKSCTDWNSIFSVKLIEFLNRRIHLPF